MKLTLMQVLIVAAAPMVATAQVPPTPPQAPPPTATPRAPRPPVLIAPRDLEFELLGPKVDEMRLRVEEMRLHAMEMPMLDVEHIKRQVEEMKLFSKLDVEHIRAQAEEMTQFAKLDVEHIKAQAEEMKHFAMLDLPMKLQGFGPSFGHSDSFLEARPRAAWAREDPADSLYRIAREALNRGEYRRAAQTFNEVTKKYPKSQYALDCAYWEAFARYRTGGTEDLREALKILDEKSVQFASMRNHEGSVDVQALRARVLGALASRGDNKAAEELR